MAKISIAAVINNGRAGTIDAQTKWRLFKLPPEVRNAIYVLVLASNATSDDGTVAIAKRTGRDLAPSVLTVLQTCRLVYSEAYGIFYSGQHLELNNNDGCANRGQRSTIIFSSFVERLDRSRLAAIENLTIRVSLVEDMTTVIKSARLCVRLKHLCLQLDHQVNFAFRGPSVEDIVPPAAMRREMPWLRKAFRTLPRSLDTIGCQICLVNTSLNGVEPQEMLDARSRLEGEVTDVLVTLLANARDLD
ncbi:uncharacterized protein LTR77_004106 [Saxophila tyrrhenica]|uniref:Uncharacterized protein n=1 Tax=Saxophila tyrrhenica TaxID=1690608 RepID=A0AAV9PET2_9PEZI|nr:hypothetical protein LTR77_004106 [Saxophila tyrrhenica]